MTVIRKYMPLVIHIPVASVMCRFTFTKLILKVGVHLESGSPMDTAGNPKTDHLATVVLWTINVRVDHGSSPKNCFKYPLTLPCARMCFFNLYHIYGFIF